MKKILLYISLALFTSSVFSQSLSRQVIGSVGGNMNSTDAKISYTVGETVVQTLKTSNGTLSQGFQQTTISVIQDNALQQQKFYASVYPNPTAGNVKVTWDIENKGTLYFRLINVAGLTVIETQVSSGNEIFLDLSVFASGIYLLTITDKDVIATFRIVKQ